MVIQPVGMTIDRPMTAKVIGNDSWLSPGSFAQELYFALTFPYSLGATGSGSGQGQGCGGIPEPTMGDGKQLEPLRSLRSDRCRAGGNLSDEPVVFFGSLTWHRCTHHIGTFYGKLI